MSSSNTDNDIPQWKKDLIARLRSQNKRTATGGGKQQQLVSSVQQPTSVASESSVEKCDVSSSSASAANMVQDRAWAWDEPRENGGKASDSDEDLRYGPGIVNKLKNRYLSLAQRESSNKVRASILPMRKAASLENILDGDGAAEPEDNRLFQKRLNGSSDTKNVPNRFRNATRGGELKRARSVEAISRSPDLDAKEDAKSKRESLNEEVLITATEGNAIIPVKMGETAEKSYSPRINRPKRITPIMNEKEKPPADVVNKAKMIFERRPAHRTKPPTQTGDVASKVATYKNIINQTKVSKKPPIKSKPVLTIQDKPKTNGVHCPKPKPPPSPKSPLPSPIPDISRIDLKSTDSENGNNSTSLTETPDLLVTSSLLPALNSPSYRIQSTENFIKEEVRMSSLPRQTSLANDSGGDDPGIKKITTPMNSPNSTTYNFAKTNLTSQHPPVNKNVLNTQTPPNQPLKVEVNGVANVEVILSPPKVHNEVKPPIVINKTSVPKPNLTSVEIEKNRKNAEKSEPKSGVVNKSDEVTNSLTKVPKLKKLAPVQTNSGNTMVFNFLDQDIPDYVHNDGRITVVKPERPKAGEGGIILLPGASIGESFTDEEEEIMRSLECPPSPCNVSFINDNILIDGKSSLSQKTSKKAKLKISFVSDGPEIYEYPSENSLLLDSPTSPLTAQMRHSVPSLTGSSSLANYTPKSTEEFQPGVTRSVQSAPPKPENPETDELILQEVETPMMFSSGANSDILF